MYSFKASTLAVAAAQVVLVAAGSPKTCPSDGPLSCQSTPSNVDTCCFNTPGGQLLQTQFWDSNPPTGPSDSWTVHGLWPDKCDGTFEANCDANRAYTNITDILQAAGATDTLSYMQKYWKDYQGQDETFWEHEWAKHGTCISTLEPSCYTDYAPQEEVVDFFSKTVSLFKGLDSYKILSNAGIVPSSSQSYALSDIQAALKAAHGAEVTLQCQSGAIDEIWYHFNVRGSVQTGEFVAAAPDGTKGSCSSTVKYLPKGSGGGTTTTSASPGPTGSPGTPFSGQGYVNVNQGGKANGCLISAGTWYTTGTCATITATPSGSGFTLSSSKGKCGVGSDKSLSCGSGVTATVFTTDSSGALSGPWGANSVASGSTQVPVYKGAGSVSLSLTWQGK